MCVFFAHLINTIKFSFVSPGENTSTVPTTTDYAAGLPEFGGNHRGQLITLDKLPLSAWCLSRQMSVAKLNSQAPFIFTSQKK